MTTTRFLSRGLRRLMPAAPIGSAAGNAARSRQGWRLALMVSLVSIAAAFRPAQAQDDFSSCLQAMAPRAAQAGVDPGAFARLTTALAPNDAPSFLHAQPEFSAPIWDYLGGLVDERRVADGRAQLVAQAGALSGVERRFGVDRRIVAAVWGIESDYGRVFGRRRVLDSLASLACAASLRRAYFETEFFAALRIAQAGAEPVDRFYGSWAGAFGQTQFMPTTYFRFAVALGGGRADIIGSSADALASTANYLRQHGWTPGLPWGFQVRPPAAGSASWGRRLRPAAQWAAAGFVRVDGGSLGVAALGLFEPTGRGGPAWLVTRNFDVLRSYNSADVYGLAIGLLADRLGGAPAAKLDWPDGERGLSRDERRLVQQILAERGYDVGNDDGVLGEKSRAAIADVERRLGMRPDGWASAQFLAQLRQGR